jgi:hypothetical protein
MAAKPH